MRNPTGLGLFLSPEDEETAINAITAIDWTENHVSEAEQAIGQAFSVEKAAPILRELLRRKLVEARPQYAAPNMLEPGHPSPMVPAKWFRTKEKTSQGLGKRSDLV